MTPPDVRHDVLRLEWVTSQTLAVPPGVDVHAWLASGEWRGPRANLMDFGLAYGERAALRRQALAWLGEQPPDALPLTAPTGAPAIAGVLYSGNMIACSGQTRLQAGQPFLQLSWLSTTIRSAPSTP